MDDGPRYLMVDEDAETWDFESGDPESWDSDHRSGAGGHGPGYAGDDTRHQHRPDPRTRAVAGPPRDGRGGGPRRRRPQPRYGIRRFLVVLLVLLLAYAGAMIWAVTSVWNSIDRVDATPTSTDRPAAGAGSTFVLVGTDSRDNLDVDQRNELVTGHSTDSARADTIMLLHLPPDGGPILISIPRDSYVPIPGYRDNKINAAYHNGGPALLVDSLEQATGLRVDGYLEIGFAGFVDVVELVDGVRMCLDEPIQDEVTRLDLPAGCQDLVGAEALNYVRMRYADPRGDLGRVERQREFLAALVSKTATPATVFLPWRLNEVGTATGSALTIGEDTSMWETARMAWAMRELSSGDGQSLTVPIADTNHSTWAGSTVLWDQARSQEIFTALREGEPLTIDP